MGIRPSAPERVGKAQARHIEALTLAEENKSDFEEAFSQVLSRDKSDILGALETFGKAMANGYPIGAVVGKREFMKVIADKVFLSSTFFPNSLEQVAALKTIEILERENVLEVIKEKGNMFAKRVTKILEDCGIPTSFSGAPWMPFITFNKDEKKLYKKLRPEFYTQLIRRKVFLQPFHHGYIAYRHTDEDLNFAADMIAEALEESKKIIK